MHTDREEVLKVCLLILAILPTGCTTTKLTDGTWEFSRKSFGAKMQLQDFEIIKPDGTRLRMKGYASDQAQAIGCAVDAAVGAAIKGAKGGP